MLDPLGLSLPCSICRAVRVISSQLTSSKMQRHTGRMRVMHSADELVLLSDCNCLGLSPGLSSELTPSMASSSMMQPEVAHAPN